MALFGKDYNEVQIGGGDYKPLPAGGYTCRILKAQITESANKLPMVEAVIDIIDGEYTQYFSERFEANKQKHGKDAKWPNNGKIRVVSVDENGNTKKLFKGFVTAIEKSNGEELPKDNDNAFIKSLKDKEIGVVFGREQFKSNTGKLLWSTKPRWYRSVESIENGDFDIPEDQYVEGNGYGFPEPVASSGIDGVDSFSAAEDDIPF